MNAVMKRTESGRVKLIITIRTPEGLVQHLNQTFKTLDAAQKRLDEEWNTAVQKEAAEFAAKNKAFTQSPILSSGGGSYIASSRIGGV